MWTVPAVSGGLDAEIDVSLPGERLKHGGPGVGEHADSVVVPNATAVAPVNPLPMICMLVPPASGPVRGVTPLTAGGPDAS
jgi:hypothetical protein